MDFCNLYLQSKNQKQGHLMKVEDKPTTLLKPNQTSSIHVLSDNIGRIFVKEHKTIAQILPKDLLDAFFSSS